MDDKKLKETIESVFSKFKITDEDVEFWVENYPKERFGKILDECNLKKVKKKNTKPKRKR